MSHPLLQCVSEEMGRKQKKDLTSEQTKQDDVGIHRPPT